eukprot:1695252-Pleurochrysis_carterae.AAC.1
MTGPHAEQSVGLRVGEAGSTSARRSRRSRWPWVIYVLTWVTRSGRRRNYRAWPTSTRAWVSSPSSSASAIRRRSRQDP